jgi:hypothetical protein
MKSIETRLAGLEAILEASEPKLEFIIISVVARRNPDGGLLYSKHRILDLVNKTETVLTPDEYEKWESVDAGRIIS